VPVTCLSRLFLVSRFWEPPLCDSLDFVSGQIRVGRCSRIPTRLGFHFLAFIEVWRAIFRDRTCGAAGRNHTWNQLVDLNELGGLQQILISSKKSARIRQNLGGCASRRNRGGQKQILIFGFGPLPPLGAASAWSDSSPRSHSASRSTRHYSSGPCCG